MPRKTELSQITCNDLRELAKMLDIPKRWSMKKAELVEAILQAENAKSSKTKESAKEEHEVVNQANNVEVVSKEKQTTDVKSDIDYEQKLQYVENAKIGALIAFKLPDGKVKSAKVTNKSTKNKKLRAETEYGAAYIVPYEDVLWVRTGLRWPKGVYRLLKGLGDKDGKQK